MIFRWRPTMGNTTKNKLNSFFCRFYSTLLNISLRRFALSDIYKVKCSFWFLTTVHLHGRRIHRAYRQTSWRLCAHGVDVHMYIYNFSLFFSPFFSVFFFLTYTIYMSTCTRSRCHSSSHAVQNNHMATLGVMTVTGWWAFTKRTVGRAGCLATKKKKKKSKSWSKMITDLWISLKVQFKQHIEDCPLEARAWGTITKFTEFIEMFFQDHETIIIIIVLFTEVSKKPVERFQLPLNKKGEMYFLNTGFVALTI